MTHAVPAIILDHVTVCYRGVPAVERVCARFEGGSSWAIVGANGAGKSTLLKAAMRLVPCDTGAVRWEHLQRQDIAYLAQQVGTGLHVVRPPCWQCTPCPSPAPASR